MAGAVALKVRHGRPARKPAAAAQSAVQTNPFRYALSGHDVDTG